jgi:hypothetical protein
MKRIEIKAGRVIETPWLRVSEAAVYVGLSRSSFEARAANVPHGGNSRTRIYHSEVLDQWVAGTLPDIPFDAEDDGADPRQRRRPRPAADPDEPLVLVQPRSRRVFVAHDGSAGKAP